MSLPGLVSDHVLSPDTQVVLLLCGRFGRSRNGAVPLNDREYNHLAVWLHRQGMRPADLLEEENQRRLDANGPPLPAPRLAKLLERGGALALVVEGWTNKGLWVISRSDDRYPARLRGRRGRPLAPPILYGAGDAGLLAGGGLAIVGSREADEEALAFVRNVAQACAGQGIQVVSGGARGVDNEAMSAALASGGCAVGVLANDLARAATRGRYRSAIQDGRLALVSPYDPDSGFNVGHAMRRNRYIYGLADNGLVASSSPGSGGTWQGAIEAIKTGDPVFVWVGGQNVPKGNQELVRKGALPFPEAPWHKLGEVLMKAHSSARVGEPVQEKLIEENPRAVSRVEVSPSSPSTEHKSPPLPETAYEAVLPVMLRHLRQPLSGEDVAKHLDVGLGQARAWLTKAVEEQRVEKRSKPVRYVVSGAGDARDRQPA